MQQGEQNNQGKGKRINERLYEYWLSISRGKAFPSENDIDPDEIKDIWDSCFLVKTHSNSGDGLFKYTYLGLALIEAYGDDITNHEISTKLIAPNSPDIAHKFNEVMKTGKPVVDESEFTNRNRFIIKYRSCMLPLGPRAGQVDYILGGMKWKAF